MTDTPAKKGSHDLSSSQDEVSRDTDPVEKMREAFLDPIVKKLQTLLALAGAYETNVPAPIVRHCSHGSVLVFTGDQIEEIVNFGTCSLAPLAMLELVEALAKRGN